VDVQRGVQSVFRAANERLRSRLKGHRGPRPVICECSNPKCMEVLDITPEDYQRVRDDGHFLVADGHETAEIERVVERRDGFVVVDKG
jgi:hypothetical protein